MTQPQDLALLESIVALTQRRIQVPAEVAFERAFGHPVTARDRVPLRLSVLRLERAGLVESAPGRRVEPTDEGRAVVAPRNSA